MYFEKRLGMKSPKSFILFMGKSIYFEKNLDRNLKSEIQKLNPLNIIVLLFTFTTESSNISNLNRIINCIFKLDNLKIEPKIQINIWEKGITAFQPTLLIQIKEAQLL
jgi:hypothetical protein